MSETTDTRSISRRELSATEEGKGVPVGQKSQNLLVEVFRQSLPQPKPRSVVIPAFIDAWFALRWTVGDAEAARIFQEITKRRRGRPSKDKPTDQDKKLLDFHRLVLSNIRDGLFDGIENAPTRETLVSFVAATWMRSYGGQSREAIEQQLRQLLSKKEQKFMKLAEDLDGPELVAYRKEVRELLGLASDKNWGD